MINKAKTSGLFRKGRVFLCLLLFLLLTTQTLLPSAAVFAAALDDETSAPVTTTLSATCRGSDNKNYRIVASYGEDAGIPADAALSVSAVTSSNATYESYVAEAEETLNCTIDPLTQIQLFDISIVSGTDNSVVYQPAEGSAVDMKVRLADEPETEFGVVHFGEETERIDSAVDGRTLTFEATGFSVYAFVNIVTEDIAVHSVDDFATAPIYLSATTRTGSTYFISSGITNVSQTGPVINRTDKGSTAGAAAYCFEKLEGTDNQFYMYLPGENGAKQYVLITYGGSGKTNASYTSAPGTVFTIVPCAATDRFYLSFPLNNIMHYLNLRKDESGKGFNGSTYNTEGSQLSAYFALPSEEDLLNLDGKTYALATKGDKNSALTENTVNVLTTNIRDDGHSLAANSVPTRANPLNESELTMIKVGGDVDLFTFRLKENNRYQITTQIGNSTKYLSISGNALSLLDEPDDSCLFKITVGTGENQGKIRITNGNTALSLTNGTASGGFSGQNRFSVYEFFSLAEPTEILEDEDFVPYTAIKVSVSDKSQVYNGGQVIVYTRMWNETNKRYEFYAIDHDGSLHRVFDEGDTIRWAGTQINTLLWDFTEYYYYSWLSTLFPNLFPPQPNYYYELQNHYSKKYLAPQYHSGQILSDNTIGINLNGRRYGDYYSTILAWDDYRYDYAGLKAEGDSVVAVPMSRAQDFYFAVMEDPIAQEFSTVETVDNNQHGIRMRMVNFQGPKYGTNGGAGGRDQGQTDVMGTGTDYPPDNNFKIPTRNLVSNKLADDGYPVATLTDKSLQELFGAATDANHLFIKSIYDESGYFEYNCCQTFATLLEGGNFRVYNQLGTPETGTISQGHGQFMPYNDIDPALISDYTNLTNVYNEALPANDPRLGETLYKIPFQDAVYHFGMEMEASFIQSKSGLDAWGHDIIFEFAGDDDFWLYVDGELVLDLGGVHSALVGKINFRTGEVVIPDPEKTDGSSTTTTLRALFEKNYCERNGLQPGDPAVEAHLDSIFTPGTSVFKDYTSHTMKMYYMERGAGASNLHMRFNLTTAVDGQLLLSKTVSGTDKEDYASAEFPFQIHYLDRNDEDTTVTRREVVDEDETYLYYEGVTFVNFKGTNDPVPFEENYHGYENVFFLKPGETAEIQFPSDDVVYYIKECRINPEIYDSVSINDTQAVGVANGAFYDYCSQQEVIEQRKVVNFDNHVSQNALRTLLITKRLFDVNYEPLHYADDPTGFRFRIYIGDDLDYYRFDSYYVKDPDGYYCWYNYNDQMFESLGVLNFDQLTDEQKEICTFTTSPSGAVDKIPADYSVEIRNLLVDTKFRIVEQDSDIPKGYDLIGYERVDGSYYAEDGEKNEGVIRPNADPHIEVDNHRGWGLTVEKVWSDSSFMTSHDNIYFAVYCKGELLPGTVRRLKTVVDEESDAQTSLYYYFKTLEDGAEFSDYTVREVELTNPVMDTEEGSDRVASYDSLTVIGGDIQLHNGGVPAQTGVHGSFTYTATYTTGAPTGPNRNVRTDTVTNTRPGIRILKTDANGQPLRGAVFTLKDADGNDVTKASYTSDAAGLVTTAYPEDGVTYTLTEISTPDGYSAIMDGIKLTVNDGVLTVTNANEQEGTLSSAVTVSEPAADGTITITIKNYQSSFSAIKVDADSTDKTPIEDAHFALYRQVDGRDGPRKDYFPMTGYEDLVTDANGVIPMIDMTLPVGAYYLCETMTPDGYLAPDHDVCFSIDADGGVNLLNQADFADETFSLLTSQITQDQELVYTLYVPNHRSFLSIEVEPQTFVADFGLDILYNVKTNNYQVPDGTDYVYIGITDKSNWDDYGTQKRPRLIGETEEQYATALERDKATETQAERQARIAEENAYQGVFEGAFGKLTLDAQGNTRYEIGSMKFTAEDEFCLVAKVRQIGETVTTVYVCEMLTYLPATTIYYEDDFLLDDIDLPIDEENMTQEEIDAILAKRNYHDGVEDSETGHNFGKWTRAGSGQQQTAQAADQAFSKDANIFGYDPAYTNFATFSNNYSHVVSVSEVNSNSGGMNGSWPYMEFDFAGTGFDIVSVTGGDTGMFTVRVYSTSTDSNGNVVVGSQVKSQVVDTYYGYTYGRIYIDSSGAPTLTQTNTPVYFATDAIVEEEAQNENATNLLKSGGKFYTRTQTYYDVNGSITEEVRYYNAEGKPTADAYYVKKTDASVVIPEAEIPACESAQYEPNYAYAYGEGWVMDNTDATSLYQIPAIKIKGLGYGTYRAKVEPRFTTRYGHYETTADGYKYYDLYVDAIRIYDPAGVGDDGTLTSETIREAYSYSRESYEKFTTLKSMIVGAETMGTIDDGTKAPEDGMVVVDGSVPLTSARLNDYTQVGPNNELYLSKNMSVAFELKSTVIPSDVQIQMKKISSAIPTLKVTYVNNKSTVYERTIDIATSTDLSYSLMDLIGRNNITWQTLKSGEKTSGLIIVSNVGETNSLISVTNLKWTFGTEGQNYTNIDGDFGVCVSNKNVTSAKRVLAFAKRQLAVAPDAQEPTVNDSGEVTLSVLTSDSVESLVVKDRAGNVIDESLLDITYDDLDDQQRQWTVTVSEDYEGALTFQVAAASDGLVSGDSLQIKVAVQSEQPQTTDPEDPTDPDDPADPADPGDPDEQTQPTGFAAFVERIRSAWLRLIDLIKLILSLFGISWS
ncbi:MAG: hypothetical protein IJK02_10315 [Clostridia bacterium]|nr:hypothetical protein [Clostridia bacterium]